MSLLIAWIDQAVKWYDFIALGRWKGWRRLGRDTWRGWRRLPSVPVAAMVAAGQGCGAVIAHRCSAVMTGHYCTVMLSNRDERFWLTGAQLPRQWTLLNCNVGIRFRHLCGSACSLCRIIAHLGPVSTPEIGYAAATMASGFDLFSVQCIVHAA